MLVTVEGIDGSGKSTVWEALGATFPEAVMTREPTDSWYGDAVRTSIGQEDADPLAELFLYTADHADHLSRTVNPALSKGRLVISDRFSDSRYAYQGATLAAHIPESMRFVQSIHEPWTRIPDLTVYLDVPAPTGVARSGGTTKFERTAYLDTVRAHYERLIAEDQDRFVRVDGSQPQAVVSDEVISIVRDAYASQNDDQSSAI